MSTIRTKVFLDELNAEYTSTRTCLERIPESLYDFRPHPTSMNLGYLALLVAEIPLWIKHMITDGEIDFATYAHFTLSTSSALTDHFEDNMEAARKALQNTDDIALEKPFSLKRDGQLLYTTPKIKDIGTSLNHWVHHRGQLTVYMRLNEIPVPSIYGPSADDRTFKAPA